MQCLSQLEEEGKKKKVIACEFDDLEWVYSQDREYDDYGNCK